jgi:assimilatory nitrate reductase catalytic subunit
MGYRDTFAYTHPAQVFAEHAALSAFENYGRRDFDLEGLTGLSEAAYDDLQPVQWPVRRAGERGEQRFFGNGGFSTPDRRARLIPVALPAPRAPAHPDALVLNTGRVRDHWHTMTRTGRSAPLCAHVAEPCAELHPRDALRRGIGDGDLVRLHSAASELLLRARIIPAQRAGSVFVPMHWSDAFASRARVNTLIAAHTDPISGQPALKQASVLAQRIAASWHGFAVTRLHLARGARTRAARDVAHTGRQARR